MSGVNGVPEDLKSLRAWIDRLDRGLVRLLSLRARAVRSVGQWKKAHGSPVHDPRREAEVLLNVLGQNRGPLPDAVLREMYGNLVTAFRTWESQESSESSASEQELQELEQRTFGIFGLGLIGGSVALALRRRFPEVRLRGCDRRADLCPTLAASFESIESEPEHIFHADIIILCAPVEANIQFLKHYGSRIPSGALVLDTSSTKRSVIEAAVESLRKDVCFIGGHPLAGKAVAGAEAAEAGLFDGKRFVLTPPRPVPAAGMRQARALVHALGASPLEMSAASHDEVLAVTSHLPQLLATSLALLGSEASVKHGDSFVFGPAFKDMTRLATSDYVMWRDISRTNSRAIAQAMDRYIAILTGIRSKLEKGGFEEEFRQAREFKNSKAA